MARFPFPVSSRSWLTRFVPSAPMPKMRPYQEMGVSSMPVYGGYIVSVERNPEWIGAWKYRTSSDIATNVSIVAAGVHYFLNLVARPTWKVVPADDTSKAKEYADFVDDVINVMITPWPRVVRRAAMYHFYGFAIQEWTALKRDDGKVGYKDIETRSQYTIEQWSVNDRGAVEGVWQRSPQTDALLPIPRNKCLYLVEDTLSDSPEGVGVFRHMAEPWNRLKKFLELETMAFERDLRGTPIGRAPLTAIRDAISAGKLTQAEGTALIEGMKQFVQMQVKSQNTGMLLDSAPYTSMSANGPQVAGTYQWGMELLQGSAIGLQELRQAIDRLQREMARIIGVEGIMLGDSPAGSRALSEDKSKALYLIANSVLNNMAAQASKDLIDPLWIMNGYEEDLKPWFQPEDVTFKDVDQISGVIRDLASAGAIIDPNDPIVDDMRDLLGVSRPEHVAQAMDAAGLSPGPDGGRPPQPGVRPGGANGGGLNGDNENGQKPKGKVTLEIQAKKSEGHADGESGKAEAQHPDEPTEWAETDWPGAFDRAHTGDHRAPESGEAGLDKGVWDEAKHPRKPSGTPTGGQFAESGAAGLGEVSDEQLLNVARDLVSEFRRKGNYRYTAGDDIQGPEIEDLSGGGRMFPRAPRAWAGVRYFGQWENPPDAEDDEDYDWQVPTDETAASIDSIVGGYAARHPNLDVSWRAEEKNWISLYVERKKTQKYSPNQPRHPKGDPRGGQWAAMGAIEAAGHVPQPGEEAPSAQELLDRFDFPEIEEFEATLPPEVRKKIEWAERELKKYVPTINQFMDENGKWTPEREALHEEIFARFFNEEAVARATPKDGEAPEVIMLGGRGGAGKTTALKSGTFIGLDTDDYMTINADELMTELPGFEGHLAGIFNGEGQYLAEKAEQFARDNGLNVIYDATLKSTNPAISRVKTYKDAGYRVASYFVHVSPQESARRSMQLRFMHEGGRYVPSKVLLANHTNEQSFDAIRPLVDKWALFDGNLQPPRLVGRGGR